MHRIFRVKAYEAEHGPHFNEEHARKAVSKMENEDGIKCKLPNTVSVPYPQLSCYNPEIFRAAAMGAYAGDAAFNGVGYNSGCGCGC